eukprot:NODE_360_length_1593_cov_103.770805_g328_i0.p1 GENE.NODE_360_length_1593_cov_103.770805_g328_i0~~NODE_360_length_1593_cov_103.770805_g328_i0.p1  ORF type:complete len:527 (+),score=92.60 NODE_360_length_1593_cov_103.770805_g328_i0:44-1582(+)
MHLFQHQAALKGIKVIALVATLAGAIGCVIYAVFTTRPGPIIMTNQYIGVWFSLMVFFTGASLLLDAFKPLSDVVRFKTVQLVWWTLLMTTSFLVFLGYVAGGELVSLWMLFLSVLSCLGIYQLLHRSHGDVDIEGRDDEHKSTCDWCSLFASVFLRGIVALFMIFLVIGAWNFAAGLIKYPARGAFVDVLLPDGRLQSIHYYCEGPVDANQPLYVFDASASHGYADFFGLQELLATAGKRACSWDKPGVGYSSYLYANQFDAMTFYPGFMQHLRNEESFTKFVCVGWGGGAGNCYSYGVAYPEHVEAFVFLESVGDQVEWRMKIDVDGMSVEEAEEFKADDLASRSTLFGVINALGIPWGLMSIFVGGAPPAGYYPADKFAEAMWFFQTAKTWATQYYVLYYDAGPKPLIPGYYGDSWNQTSPGVLGMPTLHIHTNHNMSQICENANLELGSSECSRKVAEFNFYFQERSNLTMWTGNGTDTYCTDTDCGLDMPQVKSAFIVDAIINWSFS